MNNQNRFIQWLCKAGRALAALPWARIGLIFLCSFLTLVLTVLIAGTVYVENILGQIRRPSMDGDVGSVSEETYTLPSDFSGETLDADDIETNDEPYITIAHKDIVNIMLVGADRREGETDLTRSDAMILCTVNKKAGTITLTSFMRDLYVTIPGYKPHKINSAYSWGGMPLLSKTMMTNFGVKVDGFVEVDFAGFKKVIDAIGGVSISLTAQEAELLNTEEGFSLVPGVNRLNGNEALQYSRIRSIGSDFQRTQRQRNVISAIISQCKNLSFSQINGLINSLLPVVATDMTNAQIISYAVELFPLLSGSTVIQQRIPIEGSYKLCYVGAMSVVLPDIEMNHQFLVDTLLPK